MERVLRQELPQRQGESVTTPSLATTPPVVTSQTTSPEVSVPVSATLFTEAIALSSQEAVFQLIAVTLQTYINHLKRLEIIELFGTIDYDENYDYKQQRSVA